VLQPQATRGRFEPEVMMRDGHAEAAPLRAAGLFPIEGSMARVCGAPHLYEGGGWWRLPLFYPPQGDIRRRIQLFNSPSRTDIRKKVINDIYFVTHSTIELMIKPWCFTSMVATRAAKF
jgi:hypothetical protein